MIIYGTKSEKVLVTNISEKCPNCETANVTQLFIFQKYAHFFWIPFFPLNKTGVSQCGFCKKVLKLNEMPVGFKKVYHQNLKVKAPRWMYIGTGIIGLFIISVIYENYEKNNQSWKYIKDLHKNDLFEIKLENGGGFTYYKIIDLKKDTIFLIRNKQLSITESGLENIGTKENNFLKEEPFFSTKKAIEDKLEIGDIINVVRR